MWRSLPALVLALFYFALLPTKASAGQEDGWLVLEKASHAARELSYQGVFVYQSGHVAKSMQITHMNYGQGEFARLVMLDGAPRELLKQGADAVIFNQKNEKVVIQKRREQRMFPALLPASLEGIKLNYQIKFGGTERIGGREGQIVFLEPRDQFRYGYTFWVDREYGILLKSVTNNEHNELMEQIAFTQLAMMNNQNLDWFKPSADHNKAYGMEPPALAQITSEPESWVVGQIPPGYQKIDQLLLTVAGKTVPVTQMIFSDGLASVSLFIEPLEKSKPAKTGHTAVGATNLYAAINEGHQIMVVGEVPAVTVAQFASAVSFKK